MAAAEILEQEQIERVAAPLVLEGGSFHVDGEGTVMVTRGRASSIPIAIHNSPARLIETHLKDFLGVETVIWLSGGLKDDVTDGHVDQLAAFCGPRCGCLPLTSEGRNRRQLYGASTKISRFYGVPETLKGRSLELIEIPPAAGLVQRAYRRPCKSLAHQLLHGKRRHCSADVWLSGSRSPGS